MSQLCCIVFLADSLESAPKNLNFYAKLAASISNGQLWLTCDRSVQYLLERRCTIHPRVITTRNWFLNQSKLKQSIASQGLST
jgi:HD superfamily phosphohydrolase YqeK